MRYKEVVRSFLESQSNKEYDTNPHSQLHILSQPEVIPNNSGGKENWYIKFITHYMSNLNIPGVRKMLFKRLHKQPDKDIQEHLEGNEGRQVEHTKEELEAHLQKLMKRQRRIVRLKKAVLYLTVGIGLLGGFRSLAQERPDITPAVAVNDYSFLEEYIINYFTYPQSEESQQFLQEFTTGGSWNVSYDQKIKSAEVETVDVYQVEPSDTEEGRLTSYARVSLDLKDDEGKSKRQTAYIAIRSIQKDGRYIVDRPISMISTAPAAMNEDMKKGLETEKEDIKGTDCTEQEKQEITNTIQLFFTTYAADLEQARLLMQDPETLKPLDPDTKPVFVSLQSAIQNEDEIQADVIVRYETKELFQQERSVRFLFDRKTNKIISKEEY